MNLPNNKSYEEYLASGVWKCDKSPTGAHYWREYIGKDSERGIFYCKWCYDTKQMAVSFPDDGDHPK